MPSSRLILFFTGLLALAGAALLGGGAVAARSPAHLAGRDQRGGRAADACGLVPCLQPQAHPLLPAPPPRGITAVPINEQVYVLDLTRLGVHPLDHPLPIH